MIFRGNDEAIICIRARLRVWRSPCHEIKAMIFTPLIVAFSLLAPVVQAKTERSAAQVSAFKRHNPCPANGQRRGSCPGYVVDHIKPLCAGGPDHQGNMQWQTVQDAKAKDREERRMCRSTR